MKNNKEPEKLYNIIFKAFDNSKIQKKLIEIQAVDLYNSIKIDYIKDNTRAINCNNGVLIVIVNNNSTLQYLHLKSQKIINSINKKLENKIVKDIKFIIGILPTEKNTEKETENFDINSIKLTDSQLKKIDEIVNNIDDKGVLDIMVLKKKLKNYFTKIQKYNNFKNPI